jgi:exonuclease SbcD
LKVAIIADSHANENNRFEEWKRIHEWIADDVISRGVDLLLHAGDVYDRKSSPLEREAVAAWVQKIAEYVPVVIVRGNHEAVDDLPLLERLHTYHPVVVHEGSAVYLAGEHHTRLLAQVACLAWPQRSRLAAMFPDTSSEGVEQAGVELLRDVLRGLGQNLEVNGLPDVPRIFLAHARVIGSKTSTGQELRQAEFMIGLDDLALVGADFYALGDIHLPQEWLIGEAPVVYPGSPMHLNWGEPEHKSYVIVEFDGRKLVGWERIFTPSTPMVLINEDTCRMDDGRISFDGEGMDYFLTPGSECRLRYTVSAENREAAREAAKLRAEQLIADGALSVKIEEEVKASTRARTPEVAAATTLGDKLDALWRSQDKDPGSRRPALLQKVADLEAEVAL